MPEAIPFKHDADSLLLSRGTGYILVFGFGCVVFWGIQQKEKNKILSILSLCAIDPYLACEERHIFRFGKISKVSNDWIVLIDDETLSFQLLTISYGLSQSLKLSVFENRLTDMIDKTRHVPKQLSLTGKISMGTKEINKRIGALIVEKHIINIHSDMLDSPNFLWENPEFEELYLQTINDQDLTPRLQVLNTRLDIIKDLFQVLGDELKNRHSVFLEIIIILLIAIEVIITIATHFFKL